jgi:3-oxoacyl-[acyl-carrier protein] reductase
MDLGLKGKNVLVSGGSKGIGLAIAELFAAEGANVAICARNADEVGKVVKALAAKGVKSWGKATDVADPAALKQWVEGAAGELGGIDSIVCNVSALAVGDTPDTWEKSFRTDMMHTVNSVAAALPYLEKSKSASVVIVSSVSGFEVDFAAGSYGAFKAALIHYAKGLSSQLIGKGIRRQCGVAGQHLFRGRHLAEYRERHARSVQDGDVVEPDRTHGHAAGSRRRRCLPGKSGGEPDLWHQPHYRWRAHQGRLAKPASCRKWRRCPRTRRSDCK